MTALAPLLCLQLLSAPRQDDAYQQRITPEVLVVRKVAPCVAYITTEGPEQSFRDFFGRVYTNRPVGSGSGVVIHEDGYIVTNYHVVRGAVDGKIRVAFDEPQGRDYAAHVVSEAPEEDLALLKIDGEEPFPTVELGTSSDLMIGERVLALGNPYGQTYTVSTGIISGLHRDVRVQQPGAYELHFDDLIQTDAAINPGNSGGALVNINGELIGINTVMNSQAENIGFAIPVDRIRRVLQDRLLSPSLARSWLGFDVDLETLRVERVLSGSPADAAGVRLGDLVVRLGGRDIAVPDDYRLERLSVRASQRVNLVVERDGARREMTLDAWDRIRGLLFARTGLQVEELKIQLRTSFGWVPQARLRVTSVRVDGPAAQLGLVEGDIIDGIAPPSARTLRPQSPAELAILVNALEPGTSVEVDVWRDLDGDGLLERDAVESELFRGSLVVE